MSTIEDAAVIVMRYAQTCGFDPQIVQLYPPGTTDWLQNVSTPLKQIVYWWPYVDMARYTRMAMAKEFTFPLSTSTGGSISIVMRGHLWFTFYPRTPTIEMLPVGGKLQEMPTDQFLDFLTNTRNLQKWQLVYDAGNQNIQVARYQERLQSAMLTTGLTPNDYIVFLQHHFRYGFILLNELAMSSLNNLTDLSAYSETYKDQVDIPLLKALVNHFCTAYDVTMYWYPQTPQGHKYRKPNWDDRLIFEEALWNRFLESPVVTALAQHTPTALFADVSSHFNLIIQAIISWILESRGDGQNFQIVIQGWIDGSPNKDASTFALLFAEEIMFSYLATIEDLLQVDYENPGLDDELYTEYIRLLNNVGLRMLKEVVTKRHILSTFLIKKLVDFSYDGVDVKRYREGGFHAAVSAIFQNLMADILSPGDKIDPQRFLANYQDNFEGLVRFFKTLVHENQVWANVSAAVEEARSRASMDKSLKDFYDQITSDPQYSDFDAVANLLSRFRDVPNSWLNDSTPSFMFYLGHILWDSLKLLYGEISRAKEIVSNLETTFRGTSHWKTVKIDPTVTAQAKQIISLVQQEAASLARERKEAEDALMKEVETRREMQNEYDKAARDLKRTHDENYARQMLVLESQLGQLHRTMNAARDVLKAKGDLILAATDKQNYLDSFIKVSEDILKRQDEMDQMRREFNEYVAKHQNDFTGIDLRWKQIQSKMALFQSEASDTVEKLRNLRDKWFYQIQEEEVKLALMKAALPVATDPSKKKAMEDDVKGKELVIGKKKIAMKSLGAAYDEEVSTASDPGAVVAMKTKIDQLKKETDDQKTEIAHLKRILAIGPSVSPSSIATTTSHISAMKSVVDAIPTVEEATVSISAPRTMKIPSHINFTAREIKGAYLRTIDSIQAFVSLIGARFIPIPVSADLYEYLTSFDRRLIRNKPNDIPRFVKSLKCKLKASLVQVDDKPISEIQKLRICWIRSRTEETLYSTTARLKQESNLLRVSLGGNTQDLLQDVTYEGLKYTSWNNECSLVFDAVDTALAIILRGEKDIKNPAIRIEVDFAAEII